MYRKMSHREEQTRAGEVAQWIKSLLSRCEDYTLDPHDKPSNLKVFYMTSTLEAEMGSWEQAGNLNWLELVKPGLRKTLKK